jgi:putative membrane protein
VKDSLYSRFGKDELILRDELAIDRTLLANERTLLAYLRSGVTLLIAGVTIMHFSEVGWFWTIGLTSIPAGIIAAIIGIQRYRKMKKSIAYIRARFQVDNEETLTTERADGCGGSGGLK